MDQIDMQINEMLKRSPLTEQRQYVKMDFTNADEIRSFVDSHSNKPVKPLSKFINKEIKVFGADIRITAGFNLFTDDYIIYSTFMDNCTIKLEKVLYDFSGGIAYHNKDSSGYYLYIYPEPIKLTIRLDGRILKHYEFEVMQ